MLDGIHADDVFGVRFLLVEAFFYFWMRARSAGIMGVSRSIAKLANRLRPRLRQRPGPERGRLGWLAWFKMLLAWGGDRG